MVVRLRKGFDPDGITHPN